MLEINSYCKSDIPALINDKSLWSQEHWPSTKHRLMMHLNNPNMDEDSVILIVAFYEMKMIGYIGVFDDMIWADDTLQNIGWLHSWWMNPDYRFTKAGLLLFEKMYELKKGKIGISQFTPSAGRVYYKSGKFNVLANMKGAKISFYLNVSDVLGKSDRRSVRLFAPVVRVLEPLSNLFVGLFYKIFARTANSGCRIEYVSNLDEESSNFIQRHSRNSVCMRSKNFFDWLFQYHVLISMPCSSTAEGRYFFSYKATRFSFYFIKVLNKENEMIAFLVLQLRDGLLKLLYSFHVPGVESTCAEVVHSHVRRLNCSALITYEQYLVDYYKRNRIRHLYSTPKEKEVLISKEFGSADVWADKHFNYGDGDCCFA